MRSGSQDGKATNLIFRNYCWQFMYDRLDIKDLPLAKRSWIRGELSKRDVSYSDTL